MNRKAADKMLRWIAISTVVGTVIIVAVAIIVAEHRGLLLALGAIYLLTSIGAYIGLRRSLDRAFAAQAREGSDASS